MTLQPNRFEKGFTVIEMMVVVSLIALLIALLIPAIQASRELARQSMCASNMHQLGIALHSYAADFGNFPRGHFDSPSIHGAILPYIEEGNLYNNINVNFIRNFSSVGSANVTYANITPKVFLCPSDHAPTNTSNVGWTNYAGNRGSGVQKYGYNGVFPFFPDPLVGPAAITDGMQNTALMSEWLLGDETRDPRRTNFHTSRSLADPDQLDEFARVCHNIDPTTATIAPHAKGTNWLYGDFGHTFYNHVMPINDHTCLNESGFQIGAWTAGSQHKGGAFVLFADGHTSFLKETVSIET